jgi:hypothetical protein
MAESTGRSHLNRRDPTIRILEGQTLIGSAHQILQLDIVDWNRLNGYWEHPAAALETVASWLLGNAVYGKLQVDMSAAPDRDDWPGWQHAGNHAPIGRLFWNWFHWKKRGTLVFADAPDFSGTLHLVNGQTINFFGDIGKVSPSPFLRTIKLLEQDDIWISIPNTKTQISIEPLISMQALWQETLQESER